MAYLRFPHPTASRCESQIQYRDKESYTCPRDSFYSIRHRYAPDTPTVSANMHSDAGPSAYIRNAVKTIIRCIGWTRLHDIPSPPWKFPYREPQSYQYAGSVFVPSVTIRWYSGWIFLGLSLLVLIHSLFISLFLRGFKLTSNRLHSAYSGGRDLRHIFLPDTVYHRRPNNSPARYPRA